MVGANLGRVGGGFFTSRGVLGVRKFTFLWETVGNCGKIPCYAVELVEIRGRWRECAVEYTLIYIWVLGGAVETVEMWGRVVCCYSEIVQIRFRI